MLGVCGGEVAQYKKAPGWVRVCSDWWLPPGRTQWGVEVLSGVAATDGDSHTRVLGWSMPLLNWTSSRSPTVASMTGPGTCPLKP